MRTENSCGMLPWTPKEKVRYQSLFPLDYTQGDGGRDRERQTERGRDRERWRDSSTVSLPLESIPVLHSALHLSYCPNVWLKNLPYTAVSWSWGPEQMGLEESSEKKKLGRFVLSQLISRSGATNLPKAYPTLHMSCFLVSAHSGQHNMILLNFCKWNCIVPPKLKHKNKCVSFQIWPNVHIKHQQDCPSKPPFVLWSKAAPELDLGWFSLFKYSQFWFRL